MQFHGKIVQQFHEILRKGVNQLLGDPNCETTQSSFSINISFCQISKSFIRVKNIAKKVTSIRD